jgi:hypothetical protein
VPFNAEISFAYQKLKLAWRKVGSKVGAIGGTSNQGTRSGGTKRLSQTNNSDASAAATNNIDSTHKSDDFIGKLVVFYLDSSVVVELKSSFGQKWTDDAICYLANKMHGHRVGIVIRKVIQCKSKTGRDIDLYTKLHGNTRPLVKVQCRVPIYPPPP